MKRQIAVILLVAVAQSSFGSDLCKEMSFTKSQAAQGRWEYDSSCGLCHQYNLKGRTPGNFRNETPSISVLDAHYSKTLDDNGGMTPPLVGEAFFKKWKDQVTFTRRVSDAISGFPPRNYIKIESDVRIAAFIAYMNCGMLD
jgi:hypothetical protein